MLVLKGADIGCGYRVRSGRSGYDSSTIARTDVLLAVVSVYLHYSVPIYYTTFEADLALLLSKTI